MNQMKQQWSVSKSTALSRVSPVYRALLFGYYSLEVGELEEVVVEVVEVENTHKEEGSGDENPGEQHGDGETLQAQVLQAAQTEE